MCKCLRKLERETGFEPATLALARRCSTTELFPHPSTEEAGFYRPCVKTVEPPVTNIIFVSIYVDSWGAPPSKRTIDRMGGWPPLPYADQPFDSDLSASSIHLTEREKMRSGSTGDQGFSSHPKFTREYLASRNR